ncbi:MAG TPA: BREX system Lon protease-like protein BrxL [Candidatus Limnocylindrales bacterium]|nr:BREX system Lon protease-like protein BrxL [Candidatus Limnocylindrales bacterium]
MKSSATRTFNALANRSRDDHLTDHFGLVTDYLSECWTKLREGTRISALQGRAHWGGALSGRDIEAVSKTVSGLLKLLFPNPDMPIPDQELGGGPADRPGGAPAGEGAAEAVPQDGIPQYPFQLFHGRGRRSSFRRRSCTATKPSRPTRCYPDKYGLSVYIGINIGALTVKVAAVRADATTAKVMAHQGRPLEVLQELLATPEFADGEHFGVTGHLGHIQEFVAIQQKPKPPLISSLAGH